VKSGSHFQRNGNIGRYVVEVGVAVAVGVGVVVVVGAGVETPVEDEVEFGQRQQRLLVAGGVALGLGQRRQRPAGVAVDAALRLVHPQQIWSPSSSSTRIPHFFVQNGKRFFSKIRLIQSKKQVHQRENTQSQ